MIVLSAFLALSKNEFIQQKTVESKKINLLIQICDKYPIAFDIIWALSFNQNIQQQLRSNLSFMTKLTHLAKECDNEQICKIIHGILWNLETNHQSHSTLNIDDSTTFDIMISYSHKEKVLCKQIYDELIKSGYRVWIDFDQMHGNIMDAMAKAIERSHTIIICMSEQYRKSNYCRAEAQYAFQMQRKIVPILLQKHYKADGWLLFLIGQLLYADFTKYEFPQAMEMLFKELKAENTHEQHVVSVSPKKDMDTKISSAFVSPQLIDSHNILEWTQEQVQDWLIKHNLVQMSRLLTNYDGRSLIYLHRYIKYGQPEQILNMLQEDSLRRTNQCLSLVELSQFRSLMDQQKRLFQSTISSQETRNSTSNDKNNT
ncbi:unnamed protein product [Rotaria sp. Silwood2]|nr:unnamed protein product [Rotaria sp. Silwood2]